MIGIARRLPFQQARQKRLHPFRRQQLVGQPFCDRRIELVHGDGAALAGRFALLGAGGAGIVAIAPRFAGAQRHTPATARAGRKPRQQDRPGDGARCGGFGIARLELRLDGVERLCVDDRIDRHDDLLRRRFFLPRLPDLAVEPMLALVGGAGNELVQRANAPPCPAPRPIAMIVKPCGCGLDAHGAGRAVPFPDELKDQPHDFGFDRIDRELLFGLRAALFGGDDRIAIGRRRAVPEPLPRILLHGAQHVLAVFLGLVLVKQRKDLPHHDAHRIIAEVLRDADQPDAVLAQLSHVVFQPEMVAREPAETMHDDRVKRRIARRGNIEKPLELRPVVVGTRQPRINELR